MNDIQPQPDTPDAPGASPNPQAESLAEGKQREIASPEEQALYDKVIHAAMTQLYGDDNTHQAIVQKLKSDPQNLADNVGHTAAMMVKSIAGNAQKSGVEIPPDVLYNAGIEIVAELVSICEAMKLVTGDAAETLFQKAIFTGVKAYGESLLGKTGQPPDAQGAAPQPTPQPGAIAGAMQPQPAQVPA